GEVRSYRLEPEQLQLQRVHPAALQSDSLAASVRAAEGVLGGETGPTRDVGLVNAPATLLAADGVSGLGSGVRAAPEGLGSGGGRGKLDALRTLSQDLKQRAQEAD